MAIVLVGAQETADLVSIEFDLAIVSTSTATISSARQPAASRRPSRHVSATVAANKSMANDSSSASAKADGTRR
jgi:hypothetical protein